MQILSLALLRGNDCFTATYRDLADYVDGDIAGKIKPIIGVLYDKQAAQYVTANKGSNIYIPKNNLMLMLDFQNQI
jgi:hypothetical protein